MKRGREDGEAVEPVAKKLKAEDAPKKKVNELINELAPLIASAASGKPWTDGTANKAPVIVVPEVEGWDSNYPWKEAQFLKLTKIAEDAPYGKDDKTVVDKKVRNCWQLNPEKFSIQNQEEWDKALASVLDTVRSELVPGSPGINIEATLYKLIIYGKGSFFLPHVDTPRAKNHFGTLIIVPPCKHTGGDLIVRHQGSEKQWNFSTSGKKKSSFVSFFTDCQHEITTLTKGFRVSLIYNLFQPQNQVIPVPAAPQTSPIVLKIQEILDAGKEGKFYEMGYFLEQKYVLKALNPQGLKGNDKLFYSLLESQFCGDRIRIVPLEIVIDAWGCTDSGRMGLIDVIHGDIMGDPSIEVDEIDTSGGFKEKNYKTRLLWGTDHTKDNIVWIGKDTKGKGILQSLLDKKKIDQSISGTGNEGCDWHQTYLHGAILIKIADEKKPLPYDDFSLEYAQRDYPEMSP